MQTMNDLQAKSTNSLALCPFCGGEANTLHRPHVLDWRYSVGCNDDECRGFIGLSWLYKTEAEAIAAWNTRHQCGLTDEDYSILLDELGVSERTCYIEGSYYDELMNWHYTQLSCDHETSEYKPNYCPNCGARVVGRDDR